MRKQLSRRSFLGRLAASTTLGANLPLLEQIAEAASPAAARLPQHVLGRTGASVSILAFGCGSRWLMYEDEDEALAAVNLALDLGINYLDTAYSYGDGKSETRLGKVLPTRRKEVFLATKIPDRTRDEFMRRFEGSLKRLGVDRVDLVHIHSLRGRDNLARVEAADGALKGLLQAREQKMTRFIGMSSHTDGQVMAQAIERHDLDCVQLTLNPTQNGLFEEIALPAARKKNLGVIAMKVCGQEFLLGKGSGKADFHALLRYSMSLPVATAVVGMPRLEFIKHNVELARDFTPFAETDMDELRTRLRPSRDALEKRLVGHLDGPTRSPHVFYA